MFCMICSVCSSTDGPASSPVSSAVPSWPATNTRSPIRIAWLYGAPWNGPGARSVRMTSFSAMAPFSVLGAGLRERGAERLEDRGQHVLRVLALDQANMDREPCGLGEAAERTPRRDRSEGPPALVDVRSAFETTSGFPEVSTTTIASASSAGTTPKPRPQRSSQRAAERAPRRAPARPRRPRPRARRARSRA